MAENHTKQAEEPVPITSAAAAEVAGDSPEVDETAEVVAPVHNEDVVEAPANVINFASFLFIVYHSR